MKDYDVLIIGGGPAGAMAGIELQKKGLRTCIIEKETFPRTKLCGGMLTQKSMDLVIRHCPGLDPEDFVVERTGTVDFYYEGNKLNRFPTRTLYYQTERIIFDDLLIRYYLEQGGTIMQNIFVKAGDIHFKENTITVDAKKVGYEFLVGADGCNGVLCRAAGIKRHDYLCLEGNVPRDPDKEKELRIYFGVARKGYGWYFPKKEQYCTGMVGKGSGIIIRDQAERFFKQVSDHVPEGVKGVHPLGPQTEYSPAFQKHAAGGRCRRICRSLYRGRSLLRHAFRDTGGRCHIQLGKKQERKCFAAVQKKRAAHPPKHPGGSFLAKDSFFPPGFPARS